MSKILHQLRRAARRAREIVGNYRRDGVACGTCGFVGEPLHHNVLWPALIDEWELTPDWVRWIDAREGSRCAWCGSSLRSGHLAAAIVATANALSGSNATKLSTLFRDPRACALTIAEINSAGNLHRYLARCPGVRHSEFGSFSPDTPSEDLMSLTYADASFDIVITSDTLEHVPDIDRALRETLRVVRPGGTHVFSVPVVWDRATRQRATIRNGVLTHLLPPSYHGVPAEGKSDFLVFYEFGADFVDQCRTAGFDMTLIRDAHNPAIVTFLARKPE